MKNSNHLKLWASAVALTLGSTACTVTTGSDESTDETEETEETEGTETEDSEADAGEMTDEGTDSEETEGEGTDEEPEPEPEGDAGEPEPEETDAEPEPEGDGGVTDPEGTDEEPEVEEPEPSDRSDEYTAVAPEWDCGERAPGDVEPIDNNMETDGTWSGTVYIDGEFRLRDAELVIDPGTKVILGADSHIAFGYLGAASTVRINGTEDEPVTFCGEADDVGYWRGITVDQNVVGVSNFSNVLVDGAGSENASVVLAADILVENVKIQRGAGIGLRAVDFDPDSTNLFVTGHDGMAVQLTSTDAVMNFPMGGNLSGNDEDVVHLDFLNADTDATYRDLRVPYLFDGSELRVRDGANMIVEAGSEFVMGADSSIIAGYLSDDATLQVAGAAGNPVSFRGEAEDQGFWEGIILEDNVRSDSFLQNVNISGGGSNDVPVLDVSAPIALSDISIENSGRGVRISEDGVDADSTGWTITTTDGEPLEIDVNAWPSLPADSVLTGNSDDRVLVTGNNFTTDGTIPNLGVPYLVTSEVRFRDGVETTIAAGTEFVMGADTRFVVGYLGDDATLVAEGTEDAPIRFTGLDAEPGYWDALVFENNSNSSSSLSFVEIGHAGQNSAALVLRRAISVTDCTIFESESAGIAKDADDATDYATSNTFMDNGGDDVVDL